MGRLAALSVRNMLLVLKKSISFWLLVASISLFLLQVSPLPGVFLMLVGVWFINALLVHLFLIALFVESVSGRLPRVLAIVPFLAYGAYYWAYFQQKHMIAFESAKIRNINVGKVFDFDPSTMSLVLDQSTSNALNADSFVAFHRVPVAYSQTYSARLVPASQCATMKSYRNAASAWVTRIPFYPHQLFTKETRPCLLTRIEQPANRPIVVREADHASPMQRWLGINEPSTDVVVDDRIVGSLEAVVVRPIPSYLWFLGCGLVDGPQAAWKCGGFFGEPDYIRWLPPSIDRARFDTNASILLEIPKYTESELRNFAGYPSNAAIVELAQSSRPD